ncbi:hypothetical protein [Psychrobacillus sp.]|uniref:hypothetical protein n=1 Tax=Psychrobacillus sp. TaxID=1871623 RepID=UPI0028BE5AEE|nr:hypothetical protein [Psychrobacillus sp.]
MPGQLEAAKQLLRDQLLEEAMRSPHWAIEGVHIDWTDAILLNADQINKCLTK